MEKMTQEEWLAHSEEWRRGYNAWAHDEPIDPMEPRDPEWTDGFRYAIRTVGAGPQGKVVPIEEKMPHKVSEVICVRCLKRWIGVRPEGTKLKDLECPGCHMTGAVIETGEEIEEERHE